MAEKVFPIHYDLMNSIIPMYDKREESYQQQISELQETLNNTLKTLRDVSEGKIDPSRIRVFADAVRILPPPPQEENTNASDNGAQNTPTHDNSIV